MGRQLSAYAKPAKLKELREQGWCAFEEMYDGDECRALESRLYSYVEGLDPARLAGFGATIFALAARDPLMRRELRQARVLPFVSEVLQDQPSLRRTGARISGQMSQERIIWHHHLGWEAEHLVTRKDFERVLFICYLGGTAADLGGLIVLPRSFDAPMQAMPETLFQPIAGEVELAYPPGTVVVIDAPVLHSARRGTSDKLRMIFGAHCQAQSLARAHPEDDERFENVRVGVRHQSYRLGLRDAKAWLTRANQAPLPKRSSY